MITIKNDKLKEILTSKQAIIDQGKELSVQIELKAEPIAAKFLADKGIFEDGVGEESFGDGTNHYKLFKGSYLKLQSAFKDSSIQVLQQIVSQELEEDLNALKSLESQVAVLNEQASDEVTVLLPTFNLGETEQVKTITLREDGDIDVEITDAVEEYKNNFLANKAKALATPQATPQATEAPQTNETAEVV